MKAFLLAAGLGARLRPLTETLPKPLIEVAGKPLIVHHIERLAAAGVTDIVINLHWLGELIEQYLGDGSRYGVNIVYSKEAQLLETGGGLRQAAHLLGADPFLLVSADVYTEYSFQSLMKHSLGSHLAHLVMVDNPPHNVKGDFAIEGLEEGQGLISGGDESTAEPDMGLLSVADEYQRYTYSGIGLINPSLLDFWPSNEKVFPLRSPLMKAIALKKVSGERYAHLWEDVGTLERLQCLRNRLGDRPE